MARTAGHHGRGAERGAERRADQAAAVAGGQRDAHRVRLCQQHLGGRARPAATRGGSPASRGRPLNPHFSPDGKSIAFTGDYAGNTDVYTVPAGRRRAEAPDVASRRRRRAGLDARRQVDRLRLGARDLGAERRAALLDGAGRRRRRGADAAAARLPGQDLAGRHQDRLPDEHDSWDEERRNYKGGKNRPVWIVDLKTYDLVSPPWTDSHDKDPVWVGDTVYFLSDRDGVHNVWSFEPEVEEAGAGHAVHRLRRQGARTPAAASLVFEQAGQVHLLDPKTGRAQVVNIRAAGDFPWMMPRWEDVTGRMTNIALVADRDAAWWSRHAARSSRSRPRRETCGT